MIDRDELKRLLRDAEMLIIARTQKLAEAINLLKNIEFEAEKDGDEYLMHFIRIEAYYRQTLAELDNEWSEQEVEIWDRLKRISNFKDEEPI